MSEAGTSALGRGVAEAELNQLEEVILSKVHQRVPARLSEESFLVKTFKYQDLPGSGKCDFQMFKKALGPFTAGIQEQDIRLLFERYAPTGTMMYKQFANEFASGVRRVRRRESGPPSELNFGADAPQQAWEGPQETLGRLKAFVNSAGPRPIIALAMAFREADPENSRTVGQSAFEYILNEHFTHQNCPLQAGQISQIFQLFMQPYTPGLIAYDEFLQALKDDPMSQDRRAAVRAAFRKLDNASEGLVDLNKLLKAFNVTRHPEVTDGTRDAFELKAEFTQTLEDSIAFRRGQRCFPSTLVAWEEFEDYYKFVSASIESDEAFCTILHRAWDLDKVVDHSVETRELLARPAAGIPGRTRADLHHWQSDTLPEHLVRAQDDMAAKKALERARANIAKKGLPFAVEVVQNFYSADDDVDDMLDMYEFRRACQKSGIMLRENEEEACFRICGDGNARGRDKKISLPKFLRALHGPVPPQRYALIEEAFRTMGADPEREDAQVEPALLKESFCAIGHPLVVKGEMDAGAVLNEFLNNFSLLAHVLGGCQNGMIGFTDFLAYYDLLSSTIESDAWFELLMSRLWPGEGIDGEEDQEAQDEDACMSPTAKSTARSVRSIALSAPGSPSKRYWAQQPKKMAAENPLARKKPPAFNGPGSYARTAQNGHGNGNLGGMPNSARGFAMEEEEPPTHIDTHRRFSRGPASGAAAPITKSQIVFDTAESGELGPVIQRMKASLAKRGLKGWRLLSERFQQNDYRKNGTCMRSDWQRLLKTLGLGLAPDEQEMVFKNFGVARKDGTMDYRRCLQSLRGPLVERRATLASKLFESLTDDSGRVPANTLKASFDPKNSPACLVGAKEQNLERQDFMDAVDHFAPNGFDEEGFNEFCCMMSSIYQEEDEFKLMMTAAFGLPTGNNPKARGGGC
mmetsp:Transcript_72302/g.150838  ORF Transcript_72302/g.150838 Transcript_72302/m.150838 type:complete len:918 (-) Transcript_72302:504-3257(-)